MAFLKRLLFNNRSSNNKSSEVKVYSSLQQNMEYISTQLFYTNDLQSRTVRFQQQDGLLIYLETVADEKRIQEEIIKRLESNTVTNLDDIITSLGTKRSFVLNQGPHDLVQGKCILMFEGTKEIYTINVKAVQERSITEPDNEGIIRGSHEGFIENLTTNLYLIRNSIENTSLAVQYFQLGIETKTKIALVYMQDLANPDVVDVVKRRLLSISTDSILSQGFIAEFIEDRPFSPFPQLLFTERPDRTVANLMEGRIAILSERDPTALIVPINFFAFFQSPDDYNKWITNSFIRFIRIFSILIALQLPAIYIAVIAFHPEILPLELVYMIKRSVERVPFPPLMEALLMELTLEIIREAGIRLPSKVGQTIGIVGGLVIGESVVRTGLVSYPMIIVVALTAIASFVIPYNEMSAAIRILRFPLMIMAAIFGVLGITFGLLLILIHLCKLESFGTAYFAPLSPLRIKDLKDSFMRFPIWMLNQRPHDSRPKKVNQENLSREWDSHAKSEK